VRELEFLIRFVNNLPQLEIAINCTLIVGGRLIEGELIPARMYYRLLSETLQNSGPFITTEERSLIGAMVNIFDNFAGIAINIENPRETPALSEEDFEEIYLQRAILRSDDGQVQNLGLLHLRPLAIQGFRLGSSRALR
jgi:hypothetical protein